jgi:hypothetical protein
MQHLECSGTPVLYIGHTVLKSYINIKMMGTFRIIMVSILGIEHDHFFLRYIRVISIHIHHFHIFNLFSFFFKFRFVILAQLSFILIKCGLVNVRHVHVFLRFFEFIRFWKLSIHVAQATAHSISTLPTPRYVP